MKVIDAASRFARSPVELFIEARGIDPMVTFRSGPVMRLSACPVSALLVKIVEAAEKVAPDAESMVALYWDDKTDTQAGITFDPGMLNRPYGRPPIDLEVEVDDATIFVTFTEVEPTDAA